MKAKYPPTALTEFQSVFEDRIKNVTCNHKGSISTIH